MVDPTEIRVGLVGANPDRSWAARAHIPVLTALPDYRISAVATTRTPSAEAAARQVGAEHAFTDVRELAEHPDVDLVVVTVRVPFHAELVRTAIEAGKHVYCEWPLARSSDEAEGLVKAARAAGVRHVVGLQARYAPAVAYARDIVADGHVGRVLSVAVHATRRKLSSWSSGSPGGAPAADEPQVVPEWTTHTLDRSYSAGTVDVAGGHTLDAVQYVLGDIRDLAATVQIQNPAYIVAETGERFEVTSPDHLLLNGGLSSGALISAHINDAKATAPGTRVEISGTKGDLLIVSDGPNSGAGIQIGHLRLFGANGTDYQELPIPDGYVRASQVDPGQTGFNQAQLYAQLAGDLREGTHSVPSFDDALRLHRLLEAVRRSAETGTRTTVDIDPGTAAS